MIKEIRGDIATFINAYKGQDLIFYFWLRLYYIYLSAPTRNISATQLFTVDTTDYSGRFKLKGI